MSNGTVGLDGLMTTEKDELLERMAYLEKQTTDLAEELICLKSALADCLRRVQLLESSRGTHSPMSSHVAPRTASESRASRAPTAAMAGRQSRHTPWMPSTHATSSSRRPPSQISARSTNLASPSSTAPPALPASKVSGSTGSVVRPLTAASKGGPPRTKFMEHDLRASFLSSASPTNPASSTHFHALLRRLASHSSQLDAAEFGHKSLDLALASRHRVLLWCGVLENNSLSSVDGDGE
uniref:Echinoderm microtubule associated protein n=1 Tax=Echinococcus granulosus TaxID=6210 RepID=A0A068WZR6_ECHGR|nr:echinoderm microtubule associated protein [Echinococcus granulosus]